MPQGSSPMWFGAVSGAAAGLHLGNFRATQLGFSLLLVLPTADRNSSSGNLILYGAAGLVGWDLQKSQIHSMNTPTNPSPPSLQPRQTHHRSHASQVLSYSFKSAAPYAQEPKAPKTRTPAQQNHYPPNLQGFKFGGLGFVGAIRTHKVTSYSNPSPPHAQPTPTADFSKLCPLPSPA